MIVCEVKVEMGWRRGKGKPPLGGGILLIFDIRFSPSCLEFPAKGSVLEACKEPVQLGQRGALGGFQLFYGGDAAGEFALEVEGGDGKHHLAKLLLANTSNC